MLARSPADAAYDADSSTMIGGFRLGRWQALPAVGLGLLAAVSVVVRTMHMSVGFWIDEGLSVGIAQRPVTDIPGTLRLDGSPPGYYMLLHYWMKLVGSD